ncbi:MAG: hypothetical protein JWQ95_7090 [Sphaerisporangium sp.]|nr:hypothetical protein [Sphaerisporangium sp.]
MSAQVESPLNYWSSSDSGRHNRRHLLNLLTG